MKTRRAATPTRPKRRKELSTLFKKVPRSSQNPILSLGTFHEHCKRRGLASAFESEFSKTLSQYWRSGELQPVYQRDGDPYYSTFQTWQLWILTCWKSAARSWRVSEFPKVLRLLVHIQDLYLPEIRSNLRTGLWMDYNGLLALGGTAFWSRSQMLLSALRDRRSEIAARDRKVLEKLATAADEGAPNLRRWTEEFQVQADAIDPLRQWASLVRYIAYEKRQRLEGRALLAQDFREIVELLTLLRRDADDKGAAPIALDWQSDDFEPQGEGHAQVRDYGRVALSRPFEMLEYLTNEFEINPKPRAIVLVEGGEATALELLFRRLRFSPELMGLEFRSIGGSGNFSLQNWQCFVEYMHEKQTLVYFVLDREGRAAQEAKRLLEVKRKFELPGLAKVIPSRDRIHIWGSSFEEANFSDMEISIALGRQSLDVPSSVVRNARRRKRARGLISELEGKLGIDVIKSKLAVDLVANKRLAKRGRQTSMEEFAKSCASLVLLNHQPVDPESRRRNFDTGLLG